MKIGVTGASGFIGRKLCKALMNVYKAPANVQLGDDD